MVPVVEAGAMFILGKQKGSIGALALIVWDVDEG
jgi:hypothetical protein